MKHSVSVYLKSNEKSLLLIDTVNLMLQSMVIYHKIALNVDSLSFFSFIKMNSLQQWFNIKIRYCIWYTFIRNEMNKCFHCWTCQKIWSWQIVVPRARHRSVLTVSKLSWPIDFVLTLTKWWKFNEDVYTSNREANA